MGLEEKLFDASVSALLSQSLCHVVLIISLTQLSGSFRTPIQLIKRLLGSPIHGSTADQLAGYCLFQLVFKTLCL